MATVLGELGYEVDVASRRDRTFRVSRAYDLLVSERLEWEPANWDRLGCAVRVFLATSMNHVTHNRNLRRRYRALAERRQCAIEPRRIYKERVPAAVESDAITGVGSGFTMGTWAEVFQGPIHAFDTHGLPMPEPEGKDFAGARRSFLFFAGGRQVQKGLDLLLELFPRFPDLNLYVCSAFREEPDFCRVYRRELFKTPNVHPVEWVSVGSAEFARLTRICGFVIHPSCSDGQAGSVVQTMHAGLVPLVTRETGLDTDGFGITFPDDSLGEIARVVRDASERPAEWLRGSSARSRGVAMARHTEATFADRWREIVTEVVSRGREGRGVRGLGARS